jgi:hypothetical protein
METTQTPVYVEQTINGVHLLFWPNGMPAGHTNEDIDAQYRARSSEEPNTDRESDIDSESDESDIPDLVSVMPNQITFWLQIDAEAENDIDSEPDINSVIDLVMDAGTADLNPRSDNNTDSELEEEEIIMEEEG